MKSLFSILSEIKLDQVVDSPSKKLTKYVAAELKTALQDFILDDRERTKKYSKDFLLFLEENLDLLVEWVAKKILSFIAESIKRSDIDPSNYGLAAQWVVRHIRSLMDKSPSWDDEYLFFEGFIANLAAEYKKHISKSRSSRPRARSWQGEYRDIKDDLDPLMKKLNSKLIHDFQYVTYIPVNILKLEKFFMHRRYAEVKDLNQLDPRQLSEIVAKAQRAAKKAEKGDYVSNLKKEANLEKIGETDQYKIYIPWNKAAACYVGLGTRWCTAGRDYNMFKNYHKDDNPLISFISKTETVKNAADDDVPAKFQIHLGDSSEYDQFMDHMDRPVSLERRAELLKLAHKFAGDRVPSMADRLESKMRETDSIMEKVKSTESNIRLIADTWADATHSTRRAIQEVRVGIQKLGLPPSLVSALSGGLERSLEKFETQIESIKEMNLFSLLRMGGHRFENIVMNIFRVWEGFERQGEQYEIPILENLSNIIYAQYKRALALQKFYKENIVSAIAETNSYEFYSQITELEKKLGSMDKILGTSAR